MVGVKTRSILSCFYIISCNMSHVLHIPKKILRTTQLIMIYININRGSCLKTIHQHKRTISRRRMLGAVISKLQNWEITFPFCWFCTNVCSKIERVFTPTIIGSLMYSSLDRRYFYVYLTILRHCLRVSALS